MTNDVRKPEELKTQPGRDITLCACVVKIQKASGIVLLTVRHNRYIYRMVYVPQLCKSLIKELCVGAFAEFYVTVKEEKRAMYGFELTIKDFRVLSKPQREYEEDLSRPKNLYSLSEHISNRSFILRNSEVAAVFSIRSAVENSFSEYMRNMDFLSIKTPKITKRNTEKSGYITVNYFDKNAMMTPMPDLYKIMSVAAFDRVYEQGGGYYGVNKNSRRHLNEYTRLDFELAYADVEYAMEIFKGLIKYISYEINNHCKDDIKRLNMVLPNSDAVCTFTFEEVMKILKKSEKQYNLDPTDEMKICEIAKREYDADYVFVTELPPEKRHFYEKDNTGFVILLRGMEIASGGEGISDLDEQIEKMDRFGLDINDCGFFIDSYKYAMPPHSGGTMGVERFVMQLTELSDIRLASLFVRDLHHISP